MPRDDTRVVMARVGAPHGVRGAVRLVVFSEDPLDLRRYNPFETGDGRSLELTALKETGKGDRRGIFGRARSRHCVGSEGMHR